MVEFALVLPLFLVLVLGSISASVLFFDQQSLDDAVRSAARAAIVSTSLATSNGACPGGQGESGVPATIVSAAQHGATTATVVNPAPLCVTGSSTLGQAAGAAGDITLTVTATPDLAGATEITVNATRVVYPLTTALGLHFTMASRSTLAVPS